MKKTYIKGIIQLKYRGEDKNIAGAEMSKRLYDIDPFEGKITHAHLISKYDVDLLSGNDTYNPPFLGDVRVEFENGEPGLHNLIQIVISDIVLSDVVSTSQGSYGTLAGTIHALIDDSNPSALPKEKAGTKPTGGCLGPLLKFIGILALTALLGSLLFGKCSSVWKSPVPCPEPVVLRDTVIIIRENEKVIIRTDTVRTDEEGLGIGTLQMSLFWKNTEDIDLVVKTPSGYIFFANTRAGGGIMDKDENAGKPKTSHAVENIFWSEGIPPGHYEIYASYYCSYTDSPQEVPFELRVRYKGREKRFSGRLNQPLHSTWSPESCNCRFAPTMVDQGRIAVKVFEFDADENAASIF